MDYPFDQPEFRSLAAKTAEFIMEMRRLGLKRCWVCGVEIDVSFQREREGRGSVPVDGIFLMRDGGRVSVTEVLKAGLEKLSDG